MRPSGGGGGIITAEQKGARLSENLGEEQGVEVCTLSGGCSTLESTPFAKSESRRGTTIEMDRRLVVPRYVKQKCNVLLSLCYSLLWCALFILVFHTYIKTNSDVLLIDKKLRGF